MRVLRLKDRVPLADMKFVEQTLFVTNRELEKHNTLRGLKMYKNKN